MRKEVVRTSLSCNVTREVGLRSLRRVLDQELRGLKNRKTWRKERVVSPGEGPVRQRNVQEDGALLACTSQAAYLPAK